MILSLLSNEILEGRHFLLRVIFLKLRSDACPYSILQRKSTV